MYGETWLSKLLEAPPPSPPPQYLCQANCLCQANSLKPPSNFIAGGPKAALLFGSLVISDVARCYLWLFSLYINIKIGKKGC